MEAPTDLAGGSPPASACCSNPAQAKGKCLLCAREICNNCACVVNGKPTCGACRDQILKEVESESRDVPYVRAALGGVSGALAAGAAWAAIVAATGAELGIVAVGVGYLAGQGVFFASGRRRGVPLQKLAVACAVFGLILGKYFTVVYFIKANIKGAQALSYFDPRFIPVFFDILPHVASLFDALWLFIALRAAWRIPRPTTLQVHDGRNTAPASAPAGS